MIGLSLPAGASAQDKRQIKARTLCFATVPDAGSIFISSPQGEHEILLPRNRHSNVFDCLLLDNEAVFFQHGGDGENERTVVARAKVPAAVKNALFYFTPAKKSDKLLYDVRVMNDSERAFPMGNTRILNLYGRDVRFRAGEHAVQVKPNTVVNLPQVKEKDPWNMAVISCQMLAKGDKWRTISETKTKFTSGARLLIVSYLEPGNNRPRVRFYKDVVVQPIPGTQPQ